MVNFGGPLPAAHLLYKLQITLAHKMEHAEYFSVARLCIFSRSPVWEFIVYFAGHHTIYSKEFKIH